MYYYTSNKKPADLRLYSKMCNIIICMSEDKDGEYTA